MIGALGIALTGAIFTGCKKSELLLQLILQQRKMKRMLRLPYRTLKIFLMALPKARLLTEP